MKNTLMLLCFTMINISCKKTTSTPEIVIPEVTKFCWVIRDFNSLAVIKTVCEKTAKEIAAEYPSPQYFNHRADEPLKCWYATVGERFAKNVPASLIQTHIFYQNSSFVEVNCNYCGKWYHREKRKYIPDGSFSYSPIYINQICGDSAQTLFRGREVFLRQSVDSIIVRQFSDSPTIW
jgi:hypothetical protein